MPSFFNVPLRRLTRAVAFSASTAVALVTGLYVADAYSRYCATIDTAKQSALSFSAVLAEHTARTFEAVDRTLLQAIEIRTAALDGGLKPPAANAALRQLRETSRLITAIGWTDTTGRLETHSYPVEPPRVDFSGAESFRLLRTRSDFGLFIAAPFRSAKDGRWISGVSRRIDGRDGSFAGIVTAPLDHNYFGQIFGAIDVGPHGSVSLILRDGRLIMRVPFRDESKVTSFAHTSLFTKYVPHADAGAFENRSDIRNGDRVIGYKIVPDLPLVIRVAYDRDEVLAPWYSYLRRSLPALALVVLLLGAGTILLLRQAARLGQAGAALLDASTEAEQARAASDEANRAKSRFLAAMSHELRTPLNAIVGFSEVMEREMLGKLGDARYRDYARDIRLSGTHLMGLINDILDLAKIEANRMELNEEDIRVGDLADSAIRMMREQALQGGIRLELDGPPEMPLISADRRKLLQIIVNLLSNAIKFTPAGGLVTLRCRHTVRGVLLAVADTGIGIAPEDLPKVLTAFGQVDSMLARKTVGSGLGLPLTKLLAELHGGALDIESSLGQGTTVTITIPPERVYSVENNAPVVAQLA